MLHVLCNAHHLRELIHAHVQFGQTWAETLIRCLSDAKHEVEQAQERGERALSEERLDYYDRRYDRILRDGRMAKVKQKISGCFRSAHGATVSARIRGYISTARKQKRNVFDALNGVFEGRIFDPLAY